MIDVRFDSWADADRFGPGDLNGWAVGPESHSPLHCFGLETQFSVADAIERSIVSAERDGYVAAGHRPNCSHSWPNVNRRAKAVGEKKNRGIMAFSTVGTVECGLAKAVMMAAATIGL